MKDKERKQLQNAEVVDWILKFLAGYFLSKGLDYLLKLLWSLRKSIKVVILRSLKEPIEVIIFLLFDKNEWGIREQRSWILEEFPLTIPYMVGLDNRGFNRLFGSPTLRL